MSKLLTSDGEGERGESEREREERRERQRQTGGPGTRHSSKDINPPTPPTYFLQLGPASYSFQIPSLGQSSQHMGTFPTVLPLLPKG